MSFGEKAEKSRKKYSKQKHKLQCNQNNEKSIKNV